MHEQFAGPTALEKALSDVAINGGIRRNTEEYGASSRFERQKPLQGRIFAGRRLADGARLDGLPPGVFVIILRTVALTSPNLRRAGGCRA
jgi:hypothetical protein